MSISKGEKAALNAVLKGLGVYEQFIEGGCMNYETCSFGNGFVQISYGVSQLFYNFDNSSVEGQNFFFVN